MAGTGWVFCRESMTARFDYLFIDEAGQLALADVVAMSGAARNVVLLGDPQQLPHIQQGIHPEGVGQSVLTSVLRGSPTVPADRGVFLEQTYRLQPEICRFISELAYEGRLTSVADCARHTVTGPGWSGGGLTALLIPHDGNSQKSSEEADAETRAIQGLLANATVTDIDGVPRPVRPEDIMVVARSE